MRVRKTEKVVKEVEVTTEDYNECDKCKQKIIKNSRFDVFECNIEFKEGTVYPEGGSLTYKEVELCSKCANELFNLLESFNYRIIERQVDI